MIRCVPMELLDPILERALDLGADLAGISHLEPLRGAHSAQAAPAPALPPRARSVLVLGLSHPEAEPALDWWGGPGGTDGNRHLIRVARELAGWLEQDLGLGVWILPYHVERGGLYLKDAAVLSGLGVMGINNLVITPALGPRVRWKALALDLEVGSAATAGTLGAGGDPCGDCGRPCVAACPRGALTGGRFTLSRCALQMQADEAEAAQLPRAGADETPQPVKYCRACELACPVGRV